MSENLKTVLLVAAGLSAIGIALATAPRSTVLDRSTLEGGVLTDKFTNPDDAKRLRIVRFNEDTATLREFEVAEEDGLWTIPSKNGYPADAQRQMAEAATSLMDRQILLVAGENAGDHEQYGVIDPTSPTLEAGQEGVGTRVTMSDAEDRPLVDLIIGRAVKDAEQQRYVRETNRDAVYVIEIDPAKLSTNFEDWIEKDLLQINAWDLQQVQIKDYSAEMVAGMTAQGPVFQVGWDPRADMTLKYNDDQGEWMAADLREFNPETEAYQPFTLAEGEQLDTEKLNALKDALDDLQIVDVVRKPAGLSNDLKAGQDFLENREARQDLLARGFAAAAVAPGGPEEIIASDGEVVATLKDGVQYILRFGNLTTVGQREGRDDATEAIEGQAPPASQSDVHRYMFVMAQFDETAVPKPELAPLPELPAEGATGEGADDAAESSDESDEASGAAELDQAAELDEATELGESIDIEAAEGEAASAPEAGEAAATEAAEDSAGAEGTARATEDVAAADDATADDAASESDPAAETDSVAAGEAADGGDAEAGEEAEGEAAEAAEAAPEDPEAIRAERERIEQENARRQDEYEKTLEQGREKVRELNARFGDWYFVVANDVFNKLRLGRDDVVTAERAANDEAAAGFENASPFDFPGGMIPGLPEIPGIGAETESEAE